MNPEKNYALGRVSEVVMFENWLRFYFIAEEGNALLIRIPEKALEQIQKKYGPFHGLAEYLNGEEVDHEKSLKAVCLSVAENLNGASINEQELAGILDSPEFQIDLQLFGSWVQAHEEQLDERFMEFSEWQTAFSGWKNSDEVQPLKAKLSEHYSFAHSEASETLQ